MSDIDHAAEAFRVLQLPTSMEDATEANALAYAQVHATLALVAATEKVAEQGDYRAAAAYQIAAGEVGFLILNTQPTTEGEQK